MFNTTRPDRHYVKMALAIQNMGFLRGLSPAYMRVTPAINDWVVDLVSERRDAGRRAASGCCASGRRSATPATPTTARPRRQRAPQDARRAVAREPGAAGRGRASGSRRWPRCCTGTPPATRSSTALRAGVGPRRRATGCGAYLRAYLRPLVHCLLAHDLAFMPHGENLILVLDGHAVPRRVHEGHRRGGRRARSTARCPTSVARIRQVVDDDEKALADLHRRLRRGAAAPRGDPRHATACCPRTRSGRSSRECVDEHAADHPELETARRPARRAVRALVPQPAAAAQHAADGRPHRPVVVADLRGHARANPPRHRPRTDRLSATTSACPHVRATDHLALARDAGPGHGARPRLADRGRPAGGRRGGSPSGSAPTESSGTGSRGARGSPTPRSGPTRRSPTRTARSSTPTSRASDAGCRGDGDAAESARWTRGFGDARRARAVAGRGRRSAIMLVSHALFSTFPRLLWNEHVPADARRRRASTCSSSATRPAVVGLATRGRCTGRGRRRGAAAARRRPAPDDRAARRVPAGPARVRRVRRARARVPGGAGRAALRAHRRRRRGGSPTRSRTTSRCSASGSAPDGRSALGPGRLGARGPARRDDPGARRRPTSTSTCVETERGPLVARPGSASRFPAPGRRPTSGSRACCRCCGRGRPRTSSTPCAGGSTRSTGCSPPTRDGTVLSVDAGLVVTRAPAGPPAAARRLVRGRAADAVAPRWPRPAPVPTSRSTPTSGPPRAERDLGRAYVAPYRARRIRDLLDARRPRSRPRTWRRSTATPCSAAPTTLLGWVRRADALSPRGRGAARPAARVGPAHGCRQRRRRGVRRLADRGRGAAHRPPGPRARCTRPHGRGALLDPWLGVGPRVADALPRLLGASGARDRRRGRGARGAGASGRRPRAEQPWGDDATACCRCTSRPTCPAAAGSRPCRPRRPAVRRHRLRPLHRERARRRATGRGAGRSRAGCGTSATASRSRWGVPFGASGDPASAARDRPAGDVGGRRRPSRSSPTGTCSTEETP